MIPKNMSKTVMVPAIAAILTIGARAQVQTSTSSRSGQPTSTTTVERGEVVYVSGNKLIVKMADGTIRDFTVPDGATANVDGRQLGLADLKPGMKLQRTITTTTTPKIVTTTQTVTGKVWSVTPPTSVILTLEDGTNQRFSIPKGQKFNIDGQMVDAFGLRKGMTVSATKVVESPETVVAQQRQVTGTLPPPLPPPADQPVLIVMVPAPQPAPVQTASSARPAPPSPKPAPAPEPAPAQTPSKLPSTGSDLPLIAVVGIFTLALAGGLRLVAGSKG